MAHQHFQQVEFGAGEFQRGFIDGGLAFGRIKGNVAHGNHIGRVVVRLGQAGAAQDGVDACQEFARLARLGHIVVGAHFQADDAVDVVAFGSEHDDGDFALLAHGFEHIQPAELGHHGIQHHHVVVAGENFVHAGFAVRHAANFQPFGAQVFG